MASDNEACCESDPNFAVICGFLEKFGVTCGLANIDFLDLQDMLENCQEVSQELINLHVKLLRKAKKSVSSERWERAIIKFCHSFCSQDAWEIERFGYKKARLSSKLRILKELLEMQFDYNSKFKNEVNKLSAVELRSEPLGRDRLGHVYWFQTDETCRIRVYKEDPDEETWALVVKNREGLVDLITDLNDGKETVVNEDSNSLESEKPILDTGQTDSDSSKQGPIIATEDNQEESNEKLDSSIVHKDKPEETKQVEETLNEQKESQPLKSEITPAVVSVTSGINLRIKPMSELLTSSNVDVNKKEITGVKEKYIRSDSSSVNFGHHRKAVDSAGFDVHANYLKRPLTEVEDVEVPSYIKRPRLDRPTLLGNKRKKSYSDEEEEEEDDDDDDEEDQEVSDTIEEPLMLVKGEGSGQDNKVGNSRVTSPLIIDDEIEEEVMFFYGAGSGCDCETGNDNQDKQDKSEEVNKSDIVSKDNQASSSESDSLTVSTKEFKLGTIIDVRTNKIHPYPISPTKKSRWDIGKPSESQNATNHKTDELNASQESSKVKDLVTKFENINQKDEPTEPVKRSMFFFGPGCLTFKPAIATLKTNTEVPKSSSSIEPSNNSLKEPEKESTNAKSSDIQILSNESESSVTHDTVDLQDSSISRKKTKDEDNKVVEEVTDADLPNTKGQELHKENVCESKLETPNDISSCSEAHSLVVHIEDKPKKEIEDEKINKEENQKTDSLSVFNSKNEKVSELTEITNPTLVVPDLGKENIKQTNSNNRPCSSTLNNSISCTSNLSAIVSDKLDRPQEDLIEVDKLQTNKEELSTDKSTSDESTEVINLAKNTRLSEITVECNLKSLNQEMSIITKPTLIESTKEASSKEKITAAKVETIEIAKASTSEDLQINTSESVSLSSTKKSVVVPTIESVATESLIDNRNQKPIENESNKFELKKKTDISESSTKIKEVEEVKAEINVLHSLNVPVVATITSEKTSLKSKETTVAPIVEVKSGEVAPSDLKKKETTIKLKETTVAPVVEVKSGEVAPSDLQKKKTTIKSQETTVAPVVEVKSVEVTHSDLKKKETTIKSKETAVTPVVEVKSAECTHSDLKRKEKKIKSKETTIAPVVEVKSGEVAPSDLKKKETTIKSKGTAVTPVVEVKSAEVTPSDLTKKGTKIKSKETTVAPVVEAKSGEVAPSDLTKKETKIKLKETTVAPVVEVKSGDVAPSDLKNKETNVESKKTTAVPIVEEKSGEVAHSDLKKKETIVESPSRDSKDVEKGSEAIDLSSKEVGTITSLDKSKSTLKKVASEDLSIKSAVESSKNMEITNKGVEKQTLAKVDSSKKSSSSTSATKPGVEASKTTSNILQPISKSVQLESASKTITLPPKESKISEENVKKTGTDKSTKKDVFNIETILCSSDDHVKGVHESNRSSKSKEKSSKDIAQKKVSLSSAEESLSTQTIQKVPSTEVLVPLPVSIPKATSKDQVASKEIIVEESVDSLSKESLEKETSKTSFDDEAIKSTAKVVKSKKSSSKEITNLKESKVAPEPSQDNSSKSKTVEATEQVLKPPVEPIQKEESTQKETPCSSKSSKVDNKKTDVTKFKIDEVIVCPTSVVEKVLKEPPKESVAHSKSSKEVIDKAKSATVSCENISKKDDVQVLESKQKLTDSLKSNMGKSVPLVIIEKTFPNLESGDLNKKDATISKKEKTKKSTNASKSDVSVTIDKDRKTTEVQDDNKVVEEEDDDKPVTARRSTRRTRSTTFDKVPADNKNETNTKVVKKVKKLPSKENSNKIDVLETSSSKSTSTVVPEKNEEVIEEEQPTSGRELRSKIVKKSIPIKKTKVVAPSKAKKPVTTEESPIEKKSEGVTRLTRSRISKDNKINTEEVVNVVEIEEQIIKPETRPSKKFKTSDAMEVDPPEKPKPEEESKKGSTKSKKGKKAENLEKIDVEDSKTLEPANEPECVEKKVALLTCININKLKEPSDDEDKSDSDGFDCGNDVPEDNGSDSSESVVIISERDPLDVPQSKSKPQTPMTLSTFKLDLDDSPIASPVRVTRKRAAQQSVDALRENITKNKQPTEKKSGDDSKKPKLKQKRSMDHNLRRSIEEQKAQEISSSEEEPSKTQPAVEKSKSPSKRRLSSRSNRATESPTPSSDAPSENSKSEVPTNKEKKPKRNPRILLGLEISPEIESLLKDDTPIRQSRRIAQIKIKEEAERRKLEEVTLNELKEEQRKRKGKKHIDKDYKLEKCKRSKASPTDDETTNDANESDDKKKRKRKRKHWDPTKQFDAFKAWESSSGSSSSEIEDEEEEIEDDEEHHVVARSDHEFSPESDLEEGAEVQPLKRARTARKESDAEEEEVDDCACQKCGQKDHPEWILLCDSCDSGWHCSCLRPALLVIPEGDWFCPPCQHATLVKKLEAQLSEYDKKMNKKEMEMRRKERLAYVGISLDNVLPSKEAEGEHRQKFRHPLKPEKEYEEERESEESGSEESGSESESNASDASVSDEPVYQLRERRQAHSYRFNDYDELINSAIQEEIDSVKEAGNQGRGKDISTIVNAEIEETDQQKDDENKTEVDSTVENVTSTEPVTVFEPLPPVVPVDTDLPAADADSEDDIRPVKRNLGKKKHRKLNSLDVSSEDDAESDEDFKGSSSSGSEEAEEYSVSSSSDELDTRRGKRRKDFGPIRRSTRARISRYDKDFINDSESAEEAPSRKKSKSIWDESESEESDGSWGGKSKRKAKRSQRRKPVPSDKPKKLKKKRRLKREGDDSDPEVFKRKPNIKFGGLNDEEDIGRRTRGKKINYLEALGTDSEDELRRKPPKTEESEEEYIVHEDEDFKHQIANEKDSDDSGPDTVLQDIAKLPHPKPKPRGRGKAGLKIPRKPKDPSQDVFSTTPANMFGPPPNEMFPQTSELFPAVPSDVYPPPVFQTGHPDIFSGVPPDVYPAPGGFPMSLNQQPPMLEPNVGLQQQNFLSRPMLENPDQESRDLDDEPNPIEQINKNVEQMNEQEMEKMMEEEDYANKQLQLVALQIEKEKRRREKEALRLEKIVQQQVEPKTPKKRGRKPKNQVLEPPADLSSSFNNSSLLMTSVMANNAELSEPPGINLPMFSEIGALNVDGTPRKRRGRGKGKKTLAAEAAAAGKGGSELEPGLDCQSSSNSNTISPAPDSPMHSKLGIAAPPQPFSQSQPTPSVITRMLQSQSTPGAFPSKYFTGSPGDPTTSYHPGVGGPRVPIPSGYQQPPLYVRGGPAPIGIPPGLPPIYHRSIDPSPSGGGTINVSTTNRDRNSPAVVSPASGSPLSKGEPTPPPPPYTRPQVGHFPSVPPSSTSAASRHVPMIPPPSHLQHRASGGTMSSPYHPSVPPNYHFGTYPPSHPHPPIGSEEAQPPANYPNASFPEPYLGDNGIPGQPSENNSGKGFEDDTSGEFGGLVSYFSSQREDDLDT